MKFAMKSLAMASMMAAAGVAGAASLTFNAGTILTVTDPAGSGRNSSITLLSTSGGALKFSNADPGTPYDPSNSDTIGGLIGALNAADITVGSTPGATYTEGFADDGTRRSGIAAGPLSAVVVDNQTGRILSMSTSAGAIFTAPLKTGFATGGTASVSNLRVDLTNNTIYADLLGTNNATSARPATTLTLKDQALWTFENITGPTSINPLSLLAADPMAALAADGYTNIKKLTGDGGLHYTATGNNAITGLSLIGGQTGTAFNFFVNSLGLLPSGKAALLGPPVWGRLDSSLQISFGDLRALTVMPEPSTYALMGLGLVGLAAVARRRPK
jgi:hypothetical protein